MSSSLHRSAVIGVVVALLAPGARNGAGETLVAVEDKANIAQAPGSARTSPSVAGCDEVGRAILNRAVASAGSVKRDDQTDLVRLVRVAERLPGVSPSETCLTTVIRGLVHSPTCGSAAELVTSTAALDGMLSAELLAESLSESGPCVTAVVAGVASSAIVDPQTVEVLDAWTLRQPDPMRRSGGLVVLGTLARHAREGSDVATADDIDRMIANELDRPAATEAVRAQQIEAAGNAGCLPCASVLSRTLGSPSPELRRAAVGAFRFLTSEYSAVRMCDVLDNERDPNVREQAAWALGWRRTESVTRVNCLVRAAANDASQRVRVTATTSLAGMANDVPLAQSALLHLTGSDYADANVRAVALRSSIAFQQVPSLGEAGDSDDRRVNLDSASGR